MIDNGRNEVRNEESCAAINPCCSETACCCSHSRGAATKQSSARRILSWCFSFHYRGSHSGIPRGPSRAWVCRGENIVIEWRYVAHAIAGLTCRATDEVRVHHQPESR